MLSMKFLVLGLLCERPGYGYALQQRLEERFAFLEVSPTSTYPWLDRLEAGGLIEERGPGPIGRTARGAPRMSYTATTAGRQAFREWMGRESPPPVVRDELYAKLALATPPDAGLLLRLAESQRRGYEIKRPGASGSLPVTGEPGRRSWDETVAALVAAGQVARTRAAIECVDQMIATLTAVRGTQ